MASNAQQSGGQPLRPPNVGTVPQGFGAPFPMHFSSAIPGQQSQKFISSMAPSQQFGPVGQSQQFDLAQGQIMPQFSQPMQKYPMRLGPLGNVSSSSPGMQMAYAQQNMTVLVGSRHHQQTRSSLSSHSTGLGVAGVPFSPAYTFAQPAFGQSQNGVNAPSQFQPSLQMHVSGAPVGSQFWLTSRAQNPSATAHFQQTAQKSASSAQDTNIPNTAARNSSDWQEYVSTDWRRYYYNKATKQSNWEKPLELMTPIELARELAEKAAALESQSEIVVTAANVHVATPDKQSSVAGTSTVPAIASITPVAAVVDSSIMVGGSNGGGDAPSFSEITVLSGESNWSHPVESPGEEEALAHDLLMFCCIYESFSSFS